MIKDNYFYFLFLNFFNVIIVGALLIQYNEYTVNKDLRNLFDCVWFVTITITTVGYGHRTPKKILSQITTAIISLYGSFILSFVILIINNNLDLSIWELFSTLLLKKMKLFFQLKNKNIEFIKEFLTYRFKKKNLSKNKDDKIIYQYSQLRKIGKLAYSKYNLDKKYKNKLKKNYYSDEIEIEMKNINKKLRNLNEKFEKKLRNKGIIISKTKNKIIKKENHVNLEKDLNELENIYNNNK